MEEIVLVGYGGHAESVADCIERSRKFHIAGYTDLSAHNTRYEYLGTDHILERIYQEGICNAALCIGYLGRGDIRERLFHRLKTIGFKLPVISDPSSVISDKAILGEGTFVGKGAVVNSGARVGDMCILNTMSLVEHGCRIDNFTHVAVGGILCGEVSVGERVLIGAGAVVLQGLTIPDGAIIPAGMTVRKGDLGKFTVNKRDTGSTVGQ